MSTTHFRAKGGILDHSDSLQYLFRRRVLQAEGLRQMQHLVHDDGEGVDVGGPCAAERERLVPQKLRCGPQSVCFEAKSVRISQAFAIIDIYSRITAFAFNPAFQLWTILTNT